MKVVVDHVSGSRRGQRQELSGQDRIVFGRHPSCTVSFDAHRDLDASTRHAELEISADDAVLHDIGSSNGTFVGGEKVVEHRIELRGRVVAEFGPGGPQVAIWIGRDDDPPPPVPAYEAPPRSLPPWVWLAVLAAILAVAVLLVVQLSR